MRVKQYNIPWVGAFIESFYNSLPAMSIVQFISILILLYATVEARLAWLFIAGVACVLLILLALMYLVVVPSLWTFRNKQMNRFESDILNEIRELREYIEKDQKPEYNIT